MSELKYYTKDEVLNNADLRYVTHLTKLDWDVVIINNDDLSLSFITPLAALKSAHLVKYNGVHFLFINSRDNYKWRGYLLSVYIGDHLQTYHYPTERKCLERCIELADMHDLLDTNRRENLLEAVKNKKYKEAWNLLRPLNMEFDVQPLIPYVRAPNRF